MADITMCTNHECSKRTNCYRYTAPANKYRQSYFANPPEENTCTYYWPIKELIVNK